MDIATLMLIAYRAMDERVISAMRDAGYNITVAQARLAQRIAEDGSRLVDLAEQAQVTKQTASVLVAALEREGLVERVPDPSVEQEWNDYLGPRLATALGEALTSLRELVDPYR